MAETTERERGRKRILVIIYLSCCLFTAGSGLGQAIGATSELSGFYQYLKELLSDSSSDHIRALEDYVETHPQFEPAYHRLFDLYVSAGSVQRGRSFFRRLSSSTVHSNAYWALAKTLDYLEHETEAFNAFLRAIDSDTLHNTFLLKDFVNFCHQSGRKFDSIAPYIDSSSHTSKQIIQAFYLFEDLDYRQAMRILSPLAKPAYEHLAILDVLGNCFRHLLQPDRADSVWQVALTSAESSGDRALQARFLLLRGVAQKFLRNYPDSKRLSDQAATLAAETHSLRIMHLVAAHRGSLSRQQADFQQAEVQYKRAAEIASALHSFGDSAKWYSGYAHALYFQEKYSEALKAYDLSEEHAARANSLRRLILVKQDKGDLYLFLRQNQLAKKVYTEALELAISRNLTDEQFRAKVRIADVLLLEGKNLQARKLYREYINFGSRYGDLLERAYNLGMIAQTYFQETHFDSAQQVYVQALRLAQKADSERYEALYRLRIGEVALRQGNLQESAEQLKTAQRLAAADSNFEILSETYSGLAEMHLRTGDLAAAIRSLKNAAAIIEKSRQRLEEDMFRMGYFSTRYDVYRKLAACFFQLFESGHERVFADSVLYYETLSQARVLHEIAIEKSSSSAQSQDLREYRMYRAASDKLTRIQRLSRQDPTHAEDLLPLYNAAKYELISHRLRLARRPAHTVRPLSVQALMGRLAPTGYALVLYHIEDQHSFALVATGQNFRILRLNVRSRDLALAVKKLVAPLYNASPQNFDHIPFRAKLAYQIYDQLLAPIATVMDLPERLIIVPDLLLSNLPFELLLTRSPEKDSYAPTDPPDYAGSFVQNHFTLVYSPGLAHLDIQQHSFSNARMLILGNPFTEESSYAKLPNGLTFTPLPFSQKEMKGILNYHPETTLKERALAHERHLLHGASYDIVHFATHAFSDTLFDLFSGILLAADQDSSDGILMGYEILDTRLSMDLIVLSACETALGRRVKGEGILALPRHFLASGARSVLMTQWKVDDRSAAYLMPLFYKHLFQRGASKAEALALAKREVLQNQEATPGRYHFQHPFFWASFVLYGDPGEPRDRHLLLICGSLLCLSLVVATLHYFRNRQKKI